MDDIDWEKLCCPKCKGTVAIEHTEGKITHIECDDCDHILKEDEYK
jgi:predicted  nucleic acid-binding Zn ribbon protein